MLLICLLLCVGKQGMLGRTVKFGVSRQDSGLLELEMNFVQWLTVVVAVVALS